MTTDDIRNIIQYLPLALSVKDIANILEIKKSSAYDLCHSTGFPAVQIGRKIIPKPAFIV